MKVVPSILLDQPLQEAGSPLHEAESYRAAMAARMKRLQVGDIITAEARIVFSDGRARMLAAELKTAPHLWRTAAHCVSTAL